LNGAAWMFQYNLRRLLLAVGCVAVACAILSHDLAAGSYPQHARAPYYVYFLLTHPQFSAALGGAVGTLFGQFWTGLLIGFFVPALAWVAMMLLFQC